MNRRIIWVLFEDTVLGIVFRFSPQIYFIKMIIHYILNIGLFVEYYSSSFLKESIPLGENIQIFMSF